MLKRRYLMVFKRNNSDEIESREFSCAYIKRLVQVMVKEYGHQIFSLVERR